MPVYFEGSLQGHNELEVLRQALKREATTEEDDVAVVNIGAAKRAA